MRASRAGRVLVIAGGAIAVVSTFLDWSKAVDPEPAKSAYGASVKFLVDIDAGSGGLTVGIVVFALGALAVASPFLPAGRLLALGVGVATGVVAFLYVFQFHRLIVDRDLPVRLSRLVAVGPYVAAAGGALVVLGALAQFLPADFWSKLGSDRDASPNNGQSSAVSSEQ